jgi:hypothetical protein
MTDGIIFMAFGRTSAKEAAKSLQSIRKLGFTYPAVSIGTHMVKGTEFIEWTGHSPWNLDLPDHQKFFAAYVKPFLHHYTPFDYNLYLDADTEVLGDISPGFEYLDNYDVCITDSRRWFVEDLYKEDKGDPAALAIAREERDFTIRHLGKPSNRLINSGVFFFRKNERAGTLFDEWFKEWQRYPYWDEQLALLRAVRNCPKVKVLRLNAVWNYHHRHLPNKPVIIFHKWWTARDYRVLPPDLEET